MPTIQLQSSGPGAAILESLVGKQHSTRRKKSGKPKLILHPQKKKGILTFGYLQSSRVKVLHLSSKGDALINDGKNVLMIPADSVTMCSGDEAVEGKKRLEFVQRIYNSIIAGELVDTALIYLEIQKWLL